MNNKYLEEIKLGLDILNKRADEEYNKNGDTEYLAFLEHKINKLRQERSNIKSEMYIK